MSLRSFALLRALFGNVFAGFALTEIPRISMFTHLHDFRHGTSFDAIKYLRLTGFMQIHFFTVHQYLNSMRDFSPDSAKLQRISISVSVKELMG